MTARLPMACRILAAVAAVSIAVVIAAPFGVGASVGAPSGGTSSGTVICKTLPGNGPGSVFGSCSHKKATGGSAKFNFIKFSSAFGGGEHGHVTFHWASGKITEFDVGGEDTGIGACPPGGAGHDSWNVAGTVVKDTTGKITAPLDIDLCGPLGGWTLEGPAQF